MVINDNLKLLFDKKNLDKKNLDAIGKILFDLCGNATQAKDALDLLNSEEFKALPEDDRKTIVNYKNANPNASPPTKDTTPLMAAAWNIFTHYEVIGLLIDNGADVDAVSDDTKKDMALNSVTGAFLWHPNKTLYSEYSKEKKDAIDSAIIELITKKSAEHTDPINNNRSQVDRMNDPASSLIENQKVQDALTTALKNPDEVDKDAELAKAAKAAKAAKTTKDGAGSNTNTQPTATPVSTPTATVDTTNVNTNTQPVVSTTTESANSTNINPMPSEPKPSATVQPTQETQKTQGASTSSEG